MQLLSSLSLNYAPCVYNTQNEEQENDQWLDNASGFWHCAYWYFLWVYCLTMEMCHGAHTLEGMAWHLSGFCFTQSQPFSLYSFFWMTAQKISDKIKDCRT